MTEPCYAEEGIIVEEMRILKYSYMDFQFLRLIMCCEIMLWKDGSSWLMNSIKNNSFVTSNLCDFGSMLLPVDAFF